MELKNKTDCQLIEEINKNASNEAYIELKNRVGKSYFRTLSSYCKKVPQLKYNEMAEQIDEVILKAVSSFKKEKNTQFNSWFTNHSRFFILNTIKKLNELGYFIPTENTEIDLLNNKDKKFHIDDREEIKEHVFSILRKSPDKRVIQIFEMRFFGDKTQRKWKNISKTLNLSTQQCLNIYEKHKNLLYKNMIKDK